MPFNPLKNVKLPKAEAREIAILTLAQTNEFLGTARETQWGPLLYLAIALGMRQAEIRGLTWNRVNLAERFLDVRQQLVAGHKGDGLSLAAPKTKASNRRIYLDDGSWHFLKALQAKRTLCGHNSELVFPSETGKFMDRNNLTGRVLPTILERAGVPRTTFHALRHTGASLLSSQGVAESTIER